MNTDFWAFPVKAGGSSYCYIVKLSIHISFQSVFQCLSTKEEIRENTASIKQEQNAIKKKGTTRAKELLEIKTMIANPCESTGR